MKIKLTNALKHRGFDGFGKIDLSEVHSVNLVAGEDGAVSLVVLFNDLSDLIVSTEGSKHISEYDTESQTVTTHEITRSLIDDLVMEGNPA